MIPGTEEWDGGRIRRLSLEGDPRLASKSDVLPGNPAALSWIGLRPVILRPTLSDGLPLSGRSLNAV
jgi:hypothetical protein